MYISLCSASRGELWENGCRLSCILWLCYYYHWMLLMLFATRNERYWYDLTPWLQFLSISGSLSRDFRLGQWNISIRPVSFGNLFPSWIIATLRPYKRTIIGPETGESWWRSETPRAVVATGIKIQRRRFYRLTFPLFLILPFLIAQDDAWFVISCCRRMSHLQLWPLEIQYAQATPTI